MTTRLAAGLMAFSLAAGVLLGAAGTIVLRDSSGSRDARFEDVGGAMSGMASMMGMMGGGMLDGAQGPRMSPGPGHDLHHRSASPEPAQ
jgi:hypothetical protein